MKEKRGIRKMGLYQKMKKKNHAKVLIRNEVVFNL